EGRKTRIKSLLLNQHFVAGLGNIYVDEALFEAGLHPLRSCQSLTEEEKRKLFRSIPKVLKRGLRYGGTSFQNYINSRGEAGANQERLRVYGRSGQPCRRCRSPVSRITVSQRGSHFCARCQR
ncbi:MAG: DNA-formamidopyrimidine glycosylase, partial [Acidobacteria bacterium]|nr:DNA-formamidopyrimidine glycosylase [Acidobacteriota bacterium]